MCQDKVISYLNTIRYNAILLPREQFDPFMVLGGDPGDLNYLEEVWMTSLLLNRRCRQSRATTKPPTSLEEGPTNLKQRQV